MSDNELQDQDTEDMQWMRIILDVLEPIIFPITFHMEGLLLCLCAAYLMFLPQEVYPFL